MSLLAYCDISKLPIVKGDSIYVLPLFTKEKSKKRWKKVPSAIPAMLPIECKYDEHSPYDIVENDNIKLIEKYFGLNVIFLFDAIIHNSDYLADKNRSELKDYSFAYIHKSVYDKLTVNFTNDKFLNDYDFSKETDKISFIHEFFGNSPATGLILKNEMRFEHSDKTEKQVYNILFKDKVYDISKKFFVQYALSENIDAYLDRIVQLYTVQQNLLYANREFTPYNRELGSDDTNFNLHSKMLEIFNFRKNSMVIKSLVDDK